jgi:hypothetical protein
MRVDDGLGAVKMKFQGRPATTRHLTRWKSIREELYEKEKGWQVTGRQVVRQKRWRKWKDTIKPSPKLQIHVRPYEIALTPSTRFREAFGRVPCQETWRKINIGRLFERCNDSFWSFWSKTKIKTENSRKLK